MARIAKWRRDTYWRWQDERQKRRGGGGGSTTLNLSASSFPENSALNTVIGALSVTNGTGTYTYTFTSNPGTLFNISGSNLRVTSTTIAAGSYPVTIQADNGAGSVVTRAFLLTATAVGGGTNFTATYISQGTY
jgi:hypothetical protein